MSFLDWYQFKLFVEHASGVSMDALHILGGFILFLFAARAMRKPVNSFRPWCCLLLIELVNETYDLFVERWPDIGMQLGEDAKDIALTMVLPTVLLLLARRRPDWLIGTGWQAGREG